jgi:uncharacterized membrane protein HdeD (DUF308 family)
MFLGLLVLVVGVVFLMQNLGYISGSVWEILWPSFLIIAGLLMIFRQKDSCLGVFKKKK